MHLTPYTPDQSAEIKNLFVKAFSDSGGESEGILVGNLAHTLMTETDEQDIYGFVAIERQKIIGCLFFSRLIFESNACAFILSPVAVHTDHHGKGIGRKLIQYGIQILKSKRVELIMTYGDIDFYSKVGFKPVSEDVVKAPFQLSHPEGWLGQSLISDPIPPLTGRPFCVKALNNHRYW